MRRLSEAQGCLLRLVQQYGGDGAGWGEIVLQFGTERGLPNYLETSITDRVACALERKGLITAADDGPGLTEAGRTFLAEVRE